MRHREYLRRVYSRAWVDSRLGDDFNRMRFAVAALGSIGLGALSYVVAGFETVKEQIVALAPSALLAFGSVAWFYYHLFRTPRILLEEAERRAADSESQLRNRFTKEEKWKLFKVSLQQSAEAVTHLRAVRPDGSVTITAARAWAESLVDAVKKYLDEPDRSQVLTAIENEVLSELPKNDEHYSEAALGEFLRMKAANLMAIAAMMHT